MSQRLRDRRGSGLIIALAVLALLAVMATTFMMLMRIDVRIARNYTDDQQCELLVRGMVNYFKALLRDDLDRTWSKYENRDTGVGYYSRVYKGSGTPDFVERQIPGVVEFSWGTPASNDFWFSSPWVTWGQSGGNIYYASPTVGLKGLTQQSFAWNYDSRTYAFIGRYRESSGYECDAWIGLSANCRDSQGRMVAENYTGDGPLAPIDDDGDGIANPEFTYDVNEPFTRENDLMYGFYHGLGLYDRVPLVMQAGWTGYQPGTRMTGEEGMPGGLYWRWGVKIGPTQSAYANLNVHGNLDGADSQWLGNMGGVPGLGARRAADERCDTYDSAGNMHLGRIEWQGFPDGYDAVMYHPASVSLERLFHRPSYSGYSNVPTLTPDLGLNRELVHNLIRYRWGGGTGCPGGGPSRRVGWRRDGATYFKFPSPEKPLDSDRYFGANEVMEHDHPVSHPETSAVAWILGNGAWRTLRPHVTMWSTDTILRGKIFPTEGPPYTATPGDWRHISILKRVNLNMIGADGRSLGLPGEDIELRQRWHAKQRSEQDRCWHMLKAALDFAQIDNPGRKAAQFVASLADMVDTDHDETCYAAPDGSVGLGVERHPVINEVTIYLSQAGGPDYKMARMRVELYNPFENIPWIPDVDEAYDVSQYVLQVGNHYYQLGDLHRFSSDPAQLSTPVGPVSTIGADGLYGDPDDASTWSRFVHVGWSSTNAEIGSEWPAGVTRNEIEGANFAGVDIALWKPVTGDAANPGVLPDGPYVKTLTAATHVARRYLCVDRTGPIQLVRPYGSGGTGNGPGDDPALDISSTYKARYTGSYRRWDPMNARLFGAAATLGVGTTSDTANVVWGPGYTIFAYATLGRPNTVQPRGAFPGTTWPMETVYWRRPSYYRPHERNVKIVDGDLPSIGWLGELLMWNRAADGPLTWVHTSGQDPTLPLYPSGTNSHVCSSNQIDLKAKFDLFRPFAPAGVYNPDTSDTSLVNCKALHVLDCLTVWDPSNDGIDNDGDGAVDDEDTGCQPGDKGGPEVRVFGLLDLNQTSEPVWAAVWPDNKEVRAANRQGYPIRFIYMMRQTQRESSYNKGIGPFETIGDLLRADAITRYPGLWLSGDWWGPGPGALPEGGFRIANQSTAFDNDGDRIYDERDERDMMFTWMANFFTTRANVFALEVSVDLCEPPFYPTRGGAPVRLPYKAYRTSEVYAKKQALGILDRSTCLRIRPDGSCDFSGPVEMRLFRFTDDVLIY